MECPEGCITKVRLSVRMDLVLKGAPYLQSMICSADPRNTWETYFQIDRR